MGVIQGSKGCDVRLCERFMRLGDEIILKTNNPGILFVSKISKIFLILPNFFFSKKSGYAGQSGFNER